MSRTAMMRPRPWRRLRQIAMLPPDQLTLDLAALLHKHRRDCWPGTCGPRSVKHQQQAAGLLYPQCSRLRLPWLPAWIPAGDDA